MSLCVAILVGRIHGQRLGMIPLVQPFSPPLKAFRNIAVRPRYPSMFFFHSGKGRGILLPMLTGSCSSNLLDGWM